MGKRMKKCPPDIIPRTFVHDRFWDLDDPPQMFSAAQSVYSLSYKKNAEKKTRRGPRGISLPTILKKNAEKRNAGGDRVRPRHFCYGNVISRLHACAIRTFWNRYVSERNICIVGTCMQSTDDISIAKTARAHQIAARVFFPRFFFSIAGKLIPRGPLRVIFFRDIFLSAIWALHPRNCSTFFPRFFI